MATADQVKALLHSHAEGNEERFYAIALQVAAQAARTGQVKKAQELRDLVDSLRSRSKGKAPESRPLPMAQPKGELAGLFTASYPATKLADMVLDARTRKRPRSPAAAEVIACRTSRHRKDVHRGRPGRRAGVAAVYHSASRAHHQVFRRDRRKAACGF